jgi:hypothetical protein
MMYKPVFSVTKRDGAIAVWVTMPNGEKWNIWDVNPKTFKDAKETYDAIQASFERGFEACAMIHQGVHLSAPIQPLTIEEFSKKG